MKGLLQEYEDMVATEVLGPEYWGLREQMQKVKLNLKSKASYFFNSSSLDQNVWLPVYGEKGLWLFAEEGAKWRKYDGETAAKLEDYYSRGQEFFLLGTNNYSLAKGKPDAWSEQTAN